MTTSNQGKVSNNPADGKSQLLGLQQITKVGKLQQTTKVGKLSEQAASGEKEEWWSVVTNERKKETEVTKKKLQSIEKNPPSSIMSKLVQRLHWNMVWKWQID